MEFEEREYQNGKAMSIKGETNPFAYLAEKGCGAPAFHLMVVPTEIENNYFHFPAGMKDIIVESLKTDIERMKKELELYSPGGMFAELVGNVPQRKMENKIRKMQATLEYIEKYFV